MVMANKYNSRSGLDNRNKNMLRAQFTFAKYFLICKHNRKACVRIVIYHSNKCFANGQTFYQTFGHIIAVEILLYFGYVINFHVL